jgi:hypothetical protein
MLSWVPAMKKCEKIGKIVIILAIIFVMIYLNYDKISEMNEKLSKHGINDENDQWEDGREPKNWMIDLYTMILSDYVSWYTIKEMSFYIFLSIFSVGGFCILNHYNVKHAEFLKAEQQKIFERKRKENAKSKFYKKND